MPNSQAQPISLRNHANGVVLHSSVDEFLVPEGSVSFATNVHFDRIGGVKVRPGYSIVGSQISSGHPIVGLHQFTDEGTGTDDQLIAVCNTTAYYLGGGTWTSKRTGLTADADADFTNFVDQVFMVNGSDATTVWNGSAAGSFVSTGNALSAPVGKYIDNFRSRVWIGNIASYPSRVQYSSVADGSGGILWTGDDAGYVDIAPGDGEDITGIIKFINALLVFKKNFTYRIFSVNETDPDPKIFVGTHSHKSITLAKDGVYFHHPSGIYQMQSSGAAKEISRPISEALENMASSYYSKVSSWDDNDHVYFSIGDTMIEGESISNCVLRWTISTQVWTVYSYPSDFRVGAKYDDGNSISRVVGDDDGNVYTINSGSTDNGSAINYRLDTKSYTLSGLRSETKTVRKLTALHENLSGASFGWKNGSHSFNEIQPIGDLDSQESTFDNQDIKGTRIKFCLYGSTKDTDGLFQGVELLDWLNEGVLDY